jgi:hypothetical protein
MRQVDSRECSGRQKKDQLLSVSHENDKCVDTPKSSKIARVKCVVTLTEVAPVIMSAEHHWEWWALK